MNTNTTENEKMTHSIIDNAKREGRHILTEVESKQILSEAGIDVVETVLAANADEAVKAGETLGYPLAMKIVSTDITHKTDAGGVVLNVADEAALKASYDQMMASVRKRFPDAEIQGISVQPMATEGVEVIIGMSQDVQFGPMLMFGVGGIYVELFKDVAFRIVPLTRRDAREMITEIKAQALLNGFRGSPPVNIEAVQDTLLRISDFIEAHPEIEELDINPLFATPEGIQAVDARIIV